MFLISIFVKLVGAIIALVNEVDKEAAKNTVRDRDFNLRDSRSRKALTAWLEDLLEKLLGDNRVPWSETERLNKDQKYARSKSYIGYKHSLIDKLPKMIKHVRDVPNLITQGKSLFYGTGGGVGKAAAWIDCDDVIPNDLRGVQNKIFSGIKRLL